MSYTWDTLPAVGTSETMETDIRDTLEQWRQNMEDMDAEWDAFSGGDVFGPASSTDNTIARFDGTDNKTIQGSLVSIDDSGSVNIPTGQTYKINGSAHTHSYLANVVEDTTPELGGNLDINEKSIVCEFAALTTDQTASGDIITATAGENVAFGNVCYLKSDGKFWKTDADAEATSKGLLVMAIATIAGDASGLFLKTGLARDDAWNWTVGAELFLDTATAGGMTATAPSGSTDIVRLVGYGKGADYVEFKPSTMYLEIA